MALVMEGEVFPDTDEVPQELREAGAAIQRAEYCLHLYLKHGPTFVRRLNGSFAIVVWDARDNTLHLYTDRFLSRPLFFWHRNGDFAFSSSVRSLLCCRDDIGRQYDPMGVAEFIGFERAISERTLFTDIQKFPSGAHAVLTNGEVSVTRYFRFDPGAATDLSSWKEAGHKLAHILKNALEKRFSDRCGFGLFMSGGIDSRLVLALAPDSIIGLTLVNAGTVSKEHKLALKIAAARGVRCIELPRASDHAVLKAHASVDINEGLYAYDACRCVSFFDRLIKANIRATGSALYFDQALKGYFSEERPPLWQMASPPECLKHRRLARKLSDGPLVQRIHYLDLLSLALSEELKDALAVAKEHQIQRVSQWLSVGGRIGDLSDRFAFQNLAFSGGYASFLRTNRTRFVERSVIYDNELAQLAVSLPYEWKRGGRLVRYALRAASPKLAKIEDPSTGFAAGLCPPWDTALLGIKEACRSILKRSSWCVKLVRLITAHGKDVHPFTQGAYHDNNALLGFSPKYQELVSNSLGRLPAELFDVDRIRLLFQDDLSSERPRLDKLFQPLVAFSLFDAKWEPASDRSHLDCYLD